VSTRSLFAAGRWPEGNADQEDACGHPLGVLLQRACAADWAAWNELMSRFGRLLLHTARSIGLNDSDAADVAQLTWLRLWEHGHQIRDPECLPAWLTATARREGLRVALSGKRYVLCADPTADHVDGGRVGVTDVYPVDGDYEPLLEQALARLPSGYQKLIRLLMSDSCPSYTEVAEKMDLPIGSIGPMRMRALQMLRRAPNPTAPGPAAAAACRDSAAGHGVVRRLPGSLTWTVPAPADSGQY
jgi:DNA-directed RNA polymerase specialized sigma24 family protein